MNRLLNLATLALGVVWLGAASASADITFRFDAGQVTGPDAAERIAAVQTAAAGWNSLLSGSFQLNLTIQFAPLGGALAQSTPTDRAFTYGSVRNALAARVTSSDDASAVAALPSGDAFELLINRTVENPAGAGSTAPYLDADGGINNQFLRLTTGNAKALGLIAPFGGLSDGTIVFDSSVKFAYSRDGGIPSDAFDLVGVAMHEIGHALGFMSGVGTLDAQTVAPTENSIAYVRPLDLFRFSQQSLANGVGVIDWTADARSKYFSIDGGATSLGEFTTGGHFGDGYEPGHWKPGLGLGLMSATAAPGQILAAGPNDLRAFDVLGYTLRDPLVVPEQASVVLFAIGGAAATALGRRRISRCRVS